MTTAHPNPAPLTSRRNSAFSSRLEHATPDQQDEIERLARTFEVSDDKLKTIVKGFAEEMSAGLRAHDQSCDLKMIPSWVTGYPSGNEKGVYLALEISGMDIYVCQVKLKGERGKLAINQYQYKIPDNLTAGEDMSILVDYVADCVSDFLVRVGTQDLFVYPMAVSVGFAVKQTGLNKGTIVALEHGFDYQNGVGCDVVELFHSRFKAKGLAVKVVAMANDTVCTLLAHAYQHPSTRIGIVHSAGTNCAYYEKFSNIKSLENSFKNKNSDDMIINTEWCNFGSHKRWLPNTWFDRKLDRESNNPSIHIFEKMTTGMYLGEIVRNILVYLVDNDKLFAGSSSDGLNTPYSFDTSYMYVIEADDDSEAYKDTCVILEEMLKIGPTTVADREIVQKVCEIVGRRSAMLVGAAIASVVNYMVEHGIGLDDTSDGFAISISGDLYEDYPSFHPRVCETLKALISDDIASKLSVGIVKHSRIVGAAIVAMMAEKMDSDVDMQE
ncbi:hypothetical protein K450DRAFT_218711 [Umbelopsis ramanniana AG]|uniref:Phosphotransferase n=1 Tax=Umbelopsis ramanniana AG TaxID=1314678 RepID=A0AAD5HH67_UMBRA|nr:uncharacterized protein K450DRAFT_218711 [Umbelopsis ramanniana AG]KAI8584220.1 hypothetical protein K450DRAFT_218711 [Umbelopsis ramanniana AG]